MPFVNFAKKAILFLYSLCIKVLNVFSSLKYYLFNYLISFIPCYFIRKTYLKYVLGYKIGKGTFIHLGCFFGGDKIQIGEDSVIGRNCVIIGEVSIGNHCSISAYSIIQSVSHDKNSPMFAGIHKPIHIGNYCWIGFSAIILLGVNIEDGVIVGAAALVNKSLTVPCGVYAGVPAKHISQREEEACSYILNYHPWFN